MFLPHHLDKSLDYIKQFGWIRVIRNDRNWWISTWRNILAKESKWKYILFLYNDIELTRHDFLDKILIDYQSLKNKNIWVIFPLSIMGCIQIGGFPSPPL